jgi:aspartate carbamoyltransferase regulatory subunit
MLNNYSTNMQNLLSCNNKSIIHHDIVFVLQYQCNMQQISHLGLIEENPTINIINFPFPKYSNQNINKFILAPLTSL